jgi:3-oxoacyl-[acyl-carrier protein] reductase
MDLTNKVAVITGSGRGIGKTIALTLAGAGATIVINDVGDPAPAESTAAEIRALKRDASVIMADVSSFAEATRMIDTAATNYGKIDILVNNAGITRDHLLLRLTEEEWDKVIAINLKSVFNCTKAVLKYMTKQRSGRIISMASVVGITGNAGQANYAASKAGIIGFTKTISKEVGSRGITVNAIAPGFIETQMTRDLAEEWKEEIKKRIPLGFLGSPQDVANAVAFLASEEARYISGHVLSVDGGMGGL